MFYKMESLGSIRLVNIKNVAEQETLLEHGFSYITDNTNNKIKFNSTGEKVIEDFTTIKKKCR